MISSKGIKTCFSKSCHGRNITPHTMFSLFQFIKCVMFSLTIEDVKFGGQEACFLSVLSEAPSTDSQDKH